MRLITRAAVLVAAALAPTPAGAIDQTAAASAADGERSYISHEIGSPACVKFVRAGA